MSAPDLNPLTTVPDQIRSGNAAFNATQKNDINSFNSAYSNFFNDPKNSLTSIGKDVSDSLGLPTLQANASNINTEVANLPFTYRDATRGFDVNNNQLSRVVGQRVTDLTPAMTSANNALAAGQNQYGLLTSQAQQDISNRAMPYQSQQALLSDRLARESSMFSQANQQELDGLIAKINAGVTLSEGEANRANNLAVAEKQYQGYLAQANAQVNAAKLQSQNQIVPYGATYLNTASGNSYRP